MNRLRLMGMLLQAVMLLGLVRMGSSSLINNGDELPASIPNFLMECYNNSIIRTKDYLLPMTIKNLVAIIRKIEDTQFNYANIRTLAPALLRRFRFDGIEKNPEVDEIPGVIPYGLTGSEYYLFKLLFERLIPPMQGNDISNDTLTLQERCTLHWMLSMSINRFERGDESRTCRASSNSYYSDWTHRVPRDLSKLEDVEEFDKDLGQREKKMTGYGNYQFHPGGSDAFVSSSVSSCPEENGVIMTDSGTLSPGLVIAGIYAGLVPQKVSPRDLYIMEPRGRLQRPSRPGHENWPSGPGRTQYPPPNPGWDYPHLPPNPGMRGQASWQATRPSVSVFGSDSIDNKWAATISGVLAQLAIIQGPKASNNIPLGASGTWNDSYAPKYYFINDNQDDILTDARIRGAVDGYIMGNQIQNWNSISGNIKLSQVLDMYYTRGVFDQNLKACNRKNLVTKLSNAEIASQSGALGQVLRRWLPKVVEIEDDVIDSYAQSAASHFMSYAASLPDPTCDTSQNVLHATPEADLYIVVDVAWEFTDISRVFQYFLKKLDISVYGGNLTVINGNDGTVIVNSISNSLDFYKYFNQTYYTMARSGWDMRLLLQDLQRIIKTKMDWDTRNNIRNANSGVPRIVLFVPSSQSQVSDDDKSRIHDKLDWFDAYLPDVKFLYLTPTSQEMYREFAQDKTKDVFTITPTPGGAGDYSSTLDPVISRISQIPRRLGNPNCDGSWKGSSSSNVPYYGYLDVNEIHFYKLSPNYFQYTGASLTIQSENGQGLTICTSRHNENPMSNSTKDSSELKCAQAASGSPFKLSISSDDCYDYAINCNPWYFSIAPQGSTQSGYSNARCLDAECKFPDMIKYSIVQDGLICYGAATSILASPILITLLIVIVSKLYS